MLTNNTPLPSQVRPHAPQLLHVLAAGSLAERSATARRFFLGALGTVAKLANEYDVRRLVLRLAREYRLAADVAVQRHRRLPVAGAIRWVLARVSCGVSIRPSVRLSVCRT